MAVIINNKKQSRSSARQMARAVQGREGLEAIHVIAHRRPGGVSFGAGALTLDTTGEYAREFAEIGRTLRDGAVQLWTCETSWSGAGALARSMEHVRCHTPLA